MPTHGLHRWPASSIFANSDGTADCAMHLPSEGYASTPQGVPLSGAFGLSSWKEAS